MGGDHVYCVEVSRACSVKEYCMIEQLDIVDHWFYLISRGLLLTVGVIVLLRLVVSWMAWKAK